MRVRDLLTDQVHAVRAPVIVNCAGPWVDRVRELAGVARRRARVVRTTKGIHCLLPRITDRAVYVSGEDERMVFVIPWREFSLSAPPTPTSTATPTGCGRPTTR